MAPISLFVSLLAVAGSLAQHVTVPDTCTEGFEAGTSTAIVTVPYTYA